MTASMRPMERSATMRVMLTPLAGRRPWKKSVQVWMSRERARNHVPVTMRQMRMRRCTTVLNRRLSIPPPAPGGAADAVPAPTSLVEVAAAPIACLLQQMAWEGGKGMSKVRRPRYTSKWWW